MYAKFCRCHLKFHKITLTVDVESNLLRTSVLRLFMWHGLLARTVNNGVIKGLPVHHII